MPIKFSSGPDGIPNLFLKPISHSISPILSILYNVSFATLEIPQDWRSTTVTPVFKKGKSVVAGNYRPISLASSFYQPIERCIKKSMLAHFDSNSLITQHQYGGLGKHSTTTQLLECLNSWTKTT